MVRVLPLVAVIALAAGCGGSAAKIETPAPAKKALTGGTLEPPLVAPQFSLEDASGQRFSLSPRRGR